MLRPVVLSPDVKHEDTGDEEEGHDQDWDGTTAKQIQKEIMGVSKRF